MKTSRSKILPVGRSLRLGTVVSLIWIPLAMGAFAQESNQEPERTVAANAAPVVPQQVRYAGKLAARGGQTVAAEFRIYSAQEGGEPLWSESQQFPVAADGSYSVLLGSATAAGLPQTVFAGGAARWLAISVERAQETERVLLSSVPYAMKSADAESLAGHAASDFVTQEQLAAIAASPAQADQPGLQRVGAPGTGFQPLTSGPISGSGTTGSVAVFTGANTIGNSDMVQVGNDVGINVTTPAALLDVGGTATVRGTLDLPATGIPTTAASFNSQSLELGSSAWSTTAAGPVAQNFFLENIATGNNTASPAAKLDLLFTTGTGNPAATGLSFGSNGLINFAAGQTFPGASTITTITTASPLTGGGSSGPLTLSLSLPTLEATLDTVYPQLATGNTFRASQSITGSLTTTVAVNTVALNSTTASIEGLTTAIGGINVGNDVVMHQINSATQTTPYNSPFFQFVGSGYNSSTAAAQNETFSWQTVVTGNNTASPSAYLQLLSGSGTTQTPSGLTIAPNGNINFSPTQTFPITGTGGGTITGITTSSPLTGSGTTGSVALGLNESTLTSDIAPSLETTFDSRYAKLSGGNIFSGLQEATQTAGPGNSALLGWGTNGSVGAYSYSDTGYGVEAESTSGYGVYSYVANPGPSSAGVLGFTGTNRSGAYLYYSNNFNAGIWADNAGAGTGIPVSLIVTGDDVYGAVVRTNSVDLPAFTAVNTFGTAAEFIAAAANGQNSQTYSGTGVLGIQSSNSNTYNRYVGDGLLAGVWGDSSVVAGTGVNGTADDAAAANFINNSATYHTLYIINNSTGGTGAAVLSASSPNGSCDITDGDFACTGQLKTLAATGGGTRKVETYATQSAENWMEDYGTGTMKMGVAVVRIDPAFAETVSETPDYHVFITPNADAEALYVINKTATSFEVRESKGGTSSMTFDYKIVARRRGYEQQRLVDVTARFNEERARSPNGRAHGAPFPATSPSRVHPAHPVIRPHGNGVLPNGVQAETTPAPAPVRLARPAGSRVSVEGPTTPARP